MSDDFVTRLQFQLREAAEREARRGHVARAAAAARRRLVYRPGLIAAAVGCGLVVVAVTLSALHHTAPPGERPAPPTHRLQLVASGPFVGQGGAIAPGFGAVWASDADTGELLRVDPHSRRVLARVPIGGSGFLDVGAGAVWTTVNGRLLRIDPATNQVSARIPLGLGARSLAAVSAGRGVVWVITPLELLRIDPRHNAIDRRIPLDRQGFQARDFTADPRHLYVLRADRVLLAFNASTGVLESRTRLALDGLLLGAAGGTVTVASGSDVAALAARSGLPLWRADLGAARINDGFVAGPNAWVHVTDSHSGRDRLVRLDARDGQVTGSLTLPEFGVADLAPVDGDVWIVSPNGHLTIAR